MKTRKKGYVVLLVPPTGLLLKRGLFVSGDGFKYKEPQSLRIHSTRAQAENYCAIRVKEFRLAFKQKFTGKVIEIEYTEF